MFKTICCALALAPVLVWPARADDAALARKRYAAIEKAVAKIQPITRELNGYSGERGELTAYFQNGAPRKMVAFHYFNTFLLTDELYFWQGRLFFVSQTKATYFMGTAESRRIENFTQNRFYFDAGKMARWINSNGQTIRSGAAFAQHEREQLQFAREMLAGARASAKTIQAPRS